MKHILLILILLSTNMGTVAMAKKLSTKPDWSNNYNFQANLSGVSLRFAIPGNTSKDFPIVEATNKNLYEASLYGKWSSFLLSSAYWDYQYKRFFFTEPLGTFSMKVSVHKKPENIHEALKDEQNLKQAIIQDVKNTYSIIDSSGSRDPRNLENVLLGNSRWIKYVIPGGSDNLDTTNYALKLTDDHFLNIRFEVMVSQDYESWGSVVESDIEKIMKSFSITYPQ